LKAFAFDEPPRPSRKNSDIKEPHEQRTASTIAAVDILDDVDPAG
jgi:hypothetical protein